MRLSEAIRSMIGKVKQTVSTLWKRDGEEQACAMGAALCAIGVRPHYGTDSFDSIGLAHCNTNEQWQQINSWRELPRIECPLCKGGNRVTSMVMHLNDTHKWTFEQIADWVATLEAPVASPEKNIDPLTASLN